MNGSYLGSEMVCLDNLGGCKITFDYSTYKFYTLIGIQDDDTQTTLPCFISITQTSENYPK